MDVEKEVTDIGKNKRKKSSSEADSEGEDEDEDVDAVVTKKPKSKWNKRDTAHNEDGK